MKESIRIGYPNRIHHNQPCTLRSSWYHAWLTHREVQIIIVSKALYSIQYYVLQWHESFAEYIGDMGFFMCKLEPDICIRHNRNIYEYISVYVDNLEISTRDTNIFMDALENKYKSNIKGTRTISFHIGCDFFRDINGVLCFSTHKYIYKMDQTYMTMFCTMPKIYKYSRYPL